MEDITLVTQLESLLKPELNRPEKAAGGFAESLEKAVSTTNRLQIESDRQIEKLMTGEVKNLHEVMISMEKADISLRMLVQFRNKIMEAYQETMRLQV